MKKESSERLLKLCILSNVGIKVKIPAESSGTSLYIKSKIQWGLWTPSRCDKWLKRPLNLISFYAQTMLSKK